MESPGTLILAVVALGLLFVVLPLALYTYYYYRPSRTVACPETGEKVRLDIDAGRAAWTTALARPSLRVRWCTLWPSRRGCAQECTTSPEVERPPVKERV
jgi:cbb3-type cytochrome oxidase subunit 3